VNSLDLFSCVGCHALGFLRTGIKTELFCEINPWRRARLAEQFPGVPIHDDVKTVPHLQYASIIIGGPPCQNTSKAAAIHGNRTGESLWSYMLAAVEHIRPDWVIVEQPPGHKAWETEVATDLTTAHYHVAQFEFGANDVGAPYLRRRVFLVASPGLQRLALARRALPSQIERVKRAAVARGDWDPDSIPSFGMDTWRAEGIHERRERIEALGDSNPPHMTEVLGHTILEAMQ
jgi:DNA (cytosine-5)-methyltransferase 1